MNKKKIAIIGTGPAGIFLALLLKEFNGEIYLFEENHQIGKKLKLTGGGKMNVTNKNFGVKHFFSNEERILKNFFKNNFTKNPEKIFDEMGIKYFWKGNRAILKNENSKKEVENMQNILEKRKNIFFKFGEKIYKVEKKSDKFIINGEVFDKIILSTGGILQIGKTGKEGNKKSEIYSIPEILGHKITKTEPSLSPLVIKENIFNELSGTSFFGKISNEKNQNNFQIGDILFTHKGLSGPAILDFTANEISEEIKLNFFPNSSEEKFLEKFIKNKEIKEKSKQKISDFIKDFGLENIQKNIPNKLINFLLKEKNFSGDEKISDISKKNFLEIKKNFFNLKVKNCHKMNYQFCRTTKGGIDLKGININSLESKIHKNLFFAGEVIDINGLCGGYNISFAAICAKIISEEIKK